MSLFLVGIRNRIEDLVIYLLVILEKGGKRRLKRMDMDQEFDLKGKEKNLRDEGRWNKKGKVIIFNVVIIQFFFNLRFKLKNKNRYFQLLIVERLVG